MESPRPLPHKRGTLGIFQFPSGETSDSAVYHSAFSPTLWATSKLNNAPREVKIGEQGPDPMEYPSSFFDDYDEQDDSEDLDSDDDFDESTLWEISSLLYSKDVSSMRGFLPITTEARNTLAVYDDGIRFEMEPEGQDIVTGMAAELHGVIHDPLLQLPIRPLALTSNKRSKLWTSISSPTIGTYANYGLPQPDPRMWEAYVSKSPVGVRLKPRPSETLAVLTTSSLWTHPNLENTMETVSSLWRLTQAPKAPPSIATSMSSIPSNLLWTPKAIAFGQHTSSQASTNSQMLKWNAAVTVEAAQRSSHEPSVVKSPMLWVPVVAFEAKHATAASSMLVGSTGNAIDNNLFSASSTGTRKARANNAPLVQLISSQLWSERKVLQAEHHWISESSVRPESPSVRSESSFGGSSPTSDTLSVKSSSTKASSIWDSLKSVQVSLSWNTKPVRALLPTTVVDSKKPSMSPISPPVSQPLPSKRESRVLAFRDLFESKASVPEDVPTQNLPISNRTSLVHLAAGISDTSSEPREATSQGEPCFQHPHFTPQTPEADLDQDIALYGVSPNIPYDAATRHPVFFTTNLSSSIADIHPAAIGYIQQSVVKDESFHAANHPSIAPGAGASKDHMWTDMPVWTESTANFEFLWSEDLDLQKSSKFENPREETTPRSQIWSPPQKLECLKNTTLTTVTQHSAQNMFPHIMREQARKLPTFRQLPLPTINSSQLFEPRALSLDTSVHWLNSTSSMSRTPSPSLIWEAPLNVGMREPGSAGMWSPRTDIATPSLTLSSNPHTAPWMRKKRLSMSAKDITSSELWRLSTELPGNPKHWLVDKRASRVQFRY